MFLFPMPVAPHSLPPNPALVAIILIITTRRGPRFVFHYPGIPEPSQPSNGWAFGSIGSDSEDSDDSSDDEGTTTSDPDDGRSRAASISSSRAGDSRQGSVSGRTGRLSSTTASTRRTARTLREDGPDDEEDVDDDIEALDLSATESNPGNKDGKSAEDGPGNGSKIKPLEWEKLLGYPTEGLEKLLSPPDKFKKKKFEVSLQELVFLGYPVFAREDGSWKKEKKKRKEKKRNGDGPNQGIAAEIGDGMMRGRNPFSEQDEGPSNGGTSTPVQRPFDLDSPNLSPTATRDDARRPIMTPIINEPLNSAPASQSLGSTTGLSEAADDIKSMSTASATQNGDDMSMFHVVFVMNPPTLEYHIRVQEMYDNVVKKFSKALKYEQARSGWVEKEAKKILTMKTQAKESSEW